jgi:hypothetical protein
MLEQEDVNYLKEIFVPREECNRIVAKENEKINAMALTVAKLDTKLAILIGILGAIAVPILAIAVKLLFGN